MKTPIATALIKQQIQSAFERVVSPADASYLADAVVFAASSKDGRMNPLREALDDLENALKEAPKYQLVRDTGSCRILDFGGTSPFPLMPKLHQEIADAARKHGLAAFSFRNTAGIHQLSTWIEPLCRKHDVIALFIWNGGSYTVAPFGSKEPHFGTNPIAFGIPTADDPILCDMSTSEIPFLSLMTALRAGKNLEAAVGLNAQGERTTVAKEIYDPAGDGPVRLLPMGLGYKGSSLMLLIEILTGALIGAKMGREATDSTFIPSEFGGWFLAWDIGTLTDPGDFKKRTSGLATAIKTSPKATGVEQIVLPGDRAHAAHRTVQATGMLSVDEVDHARLLKLAGGG